MEFLAGDLLTPLSVIGLIVLSAVTSMISAAFGAGGGLMLLVVLYGFVGFSFWQWLPLVTVMIISGALGTWLGLQLLQRISADKFKRIFRVILTLLALQLAWQGLQAF